MKKILLMAVAAFFATTVFAQTDGGQNNRRGMNDGVISMKVIEQMELGSDVVAKVSALREKKHSEMAEKFKKNADKKKDKDNKDKDAKKAERQDAMKKQAEEMKAWKKAYRAELRKILGDEAYIDYLERMADMPRFMMGGQGQQRPMNGGPRGGRGGFGGGFGNFDMDGSM